MKSMKRVWVMMCLQVMAFGWASCASLRMPRTTDAEKLRGQTAAEVRSKLGQPASSRSVGGQQFLEYFLASESESHPSPNPKLHLLVFDQNERLVRIEVAP